MCNVTFGIKIPEELKNQITKLMDDIGLSENEFMQQVINTYAMEKTKENIPQFAEDLKELQILTKRINNIYLNLGYRLDNFTKSQEEEKQKLLQAKENLIVDLQSKYEKLKQNYDLLKNEYNESINSNIELTQILN
jgi:predicted RNase H-like nuclease (RuvC/YqgF family)